MLNILSNQVFLNFGGIKLSHPLNFFLILLVLNVFVPVQVVIEVDDLAKGHPIEDLHSLECRVVQREPAQSNGQNGRACHQFGPLLCINARITLTTAVLVVTVEDLRFDVVLQGHFDRGI